MGWAIIPEWMDLRHGSSSETARSHKRPSSDQDIITSLVDSTDLMQFVPLGSLLMYRIHEMLFKNPILIHVNTTVLVALAQPLEQSFLMCKQK